jgi:hypothetical protein
MWRTDESEKNGDKAPKKNIRYLSMRVRTVSGSAFPFADGADLGKLLYDFK